MAGDLIGQQLGPFRITDFLGTAPAADVYRGSSPEAGLDVLIKMVHGAPEASLLGSGFHREAKNAARLRHPNIAQVYDFGEANGGHYLIVRDISGTPLSEYFAEAQAAGEHFTPDDITFIVRQIAAALEEAHRHDVLHRTLSPENVIITRSGQAVLTDFGLALLAAQQGEAEGKPLGPPEYIAPEVHGNLRAASAASDVYSLGVIAYEMVTGGRPYDFDSEIEIALRDLADTAPDPRLVRADTPKAVSAVLLKALATLPKERYGSAVKFAAALERAYERGEAPAPARQRALAEAVSGAADDAQPAAVDHFASTEDVATSHRRRRRRRRVLNLSRLVIATALLLLLVGAAGFLLDSLGVISLPFGPTFAQTEEPGAAALPTPSTTPEPTRDLPPTLTLVPSATPLQAASATAIPPVVSASLEAGSSAFRLDDGGILHFVPAGIFQMGTDDPTRGSDSRPQHPVMLGDYWIDRTEVTNAQYALCVEAGACTPPVTRRYYDSANYASHPVTYVQHTQAVSYCLWLARETGQPVGLPTEAQWEKAAAWDPAAGASRTFPWGDQEPNADLLRFATSGFGGAAPVGTYAEGASAYGVLDMAGNVWEWTADWYAEDAYRHTGVVTDPAGPSSGTRRVTRGGGWLTERPLLVTNVRNWASPEAAGDDLGFRCALNTRDPADGSGILLTPLDLTRALFGEFEAAREQAGADTGAISGWEEALTRLETALVEGRDDTARAIIEDRLVQVTRQRSSEALPSGLALRLDSAMLWMKGVLAEEES